MKKYLLLFAAVAALTSFAPAASNAQGLSVEVPGVGVRVGEPRYRERDYDRPRYRERERFRERDVRSDRGCKTITIQRDDGSMKRIRRCN